MTWDEYFHSICKVVGSRSKCLSRQIGSVLVVDNIIVCTGFNGPPRGVPHCRERYVVDNYLKERIKQRPFSGVTEDMCPRKYLGYPSGHGLDLCIAAHAERNCIIQAARLGIMTKGATLYMDCPIPCGDCLIEIINSGIKELVVTSLDHYDKKSSFLIDNCNVIIRTFEGVEYHGGY